MVIAEIADCSIAHLNTLHFSIISPRPNFTDLHLSSLNQKTGTFFNNSQILFNKILSWRVAVGCLGHRGSDARNGQLKIFSLFVLFFLLLRSIKKFQFFCVASTFASTRFLSKQQLQQQQQQQQQLQQLTHFFNLSSFLRLNSSSFFPLASVSQIFDRATRRF